jgi:transposase InsO family protein
VAVNKGLRIAKLCELYGVKRETYYAWNKRPESKRSKRRKELATKVQKAFFTGHKIPGSRKIAADLSTPEIPVSRTLVAKIMKENGWKSKVVKKYKATTNSNHNLPVAENKLDRQFTAEHPNQKWVSDITYIPTDEGWLYLAGILDLHGREIAGWAMSDRLTKDLVIDCFHQACPDAGIHQMFLFIPIVGASIALMTIRRSWRFRDLSAR